MKLKEIAERINEHLKRFASDPVINKMDPKFRTHPYWSPGAYAAGAYVRVWYVSYQRSSHLRKDDALKYLEWLERGNVGKHYGLFR